MGLLCPFLHGVCRIISINSMSEMLSKVELKQQNLTGTAHLASQQALEVIDELIQGNERHIRVQTCCVCSVYK